MTALMGKGRGREGVGEEEREEEREEEEERKGNELFTNAWHIFYVAAILERVLDKNKRVQEAACSAVLYGFRCFLGFPFFHLSG